VLALPTLAPVAWSFAQAKSEEQVNPGRFASDVGYMSDGIRAAREYL
jgi:hypothetical protein